MFLSATEPTFVSDTQQDENIYEIQFRDLAQNGHVHIIKYKWISIFDY